MLRLSKNPARSLLLLVLASCSNLAGIEEKPCQPGCFGEATRLVCDADGTPRYEACTSKEPCATSTCSAGACVVQPAVGKACGPNSLATCNEGYACIGPDTRLSAIRTHTCAVADDGKIWCWGENTSSKLGDGTVEFGGYPVLVRGLPAPAIDVSVGYEHTCAILQPADTSITAGEGVEKAGDVYCWGNNDGGQCGTGITSPPIVTPRHVEVAGARFTAVKAGQGHTCAIAEDRTVYCWGYTGFGQCGVAPGPADSPIVGPTRIGNLERVSQIETVKDHTCAVREASPSMVCWGSNFYLGPEKTEKYGQPATLVVHKLGPGAKGAMFSAVPVPVELKVTDGTGQERVLEVLDVGMGFESTYAVTLDRRVYAWGWNASGQLGILNTDPLVAEPSVVMARNPVQGTPEVFTGARNVLRSDGSDQCIDLETDSVNNRYWCWGADHSGELGTGTEDVRLQFAEPVTVVPRSARRMVHGQDHACVLVNENGTDEIWCYGRPYVIADGTTDSAKSIPNRMVAAPVMWKHENFWPALEE